MEKYKLTLFKDQERRMKTAWETYLNEQVEHYDTDEITLRESLINLADWGEEWLKDMAEWRARKSDR